uniref:Uncharacterized protein n=1 Tax=Tanacetum cinerariifolium TaxID=118510 RepID=A0A6L2LFR4_TANCI|nr:hypothetical protein [Tanacetum cinerariifolium]
MGEEKIKAAFKEFKKYEDDKVEHRCTEMDARLDKLSVDFDEELYSHMLTAIAGRHWVIGHGLRLAIIMCAESTEIRQAFADVVSARLAKGMSEGLKFGIEHGKAGQDLADVEAEDTPQWMRDLPLSSSKLKILVYPKVRDPEDPWAVKEEVLLKDAIAANISRAEKKKKCKIPHGLLVHKQSFSLSGFGFIQVKSLSPQVVAAAKLPILNPNEFDLWKMRIEQYFLMTDYSLWEVILNVKSLSPQVVAVAKLPILNPNEFDLWKMRIEQYFLMTDYSLWEVILNGDSPTPTRVVDDPLRKFNGKADERFLVGYFVNSKAFRIFNSRTRIVQETLHINFLENQPNVAGSGPTWLFDIDTLTMNYQPVVAWNQPNSTAYVDAACDDKETKSEVHVSPSSGDKTKKHNEKAKREAKGKSHVDFPQDALVTAVRPNLTNSTNSFNVACPSDNTVNIVYSNDKEDVGAEADFSNLETSITISPIPTTRVHKDHPVTQIIGDLSSAFQTRSMTRVVKDQDLPKGKRAIGSKWVFRNKKDERGIIIMNKARLVAQGHTQEEGIDYEEVFSIVARIEAIRLFLAYASFMGFMVYQMDVKSAFLYGTIKEEVYIYRPPGFEDPDYSDKVYKVVKVLYGLHQAPRACYETLANYLLENGLQVKQKDNGIFISQDKYVAKILRKFGLTDGKLASTPIDIEKPLLKDPDGDDVDVHIYWSMIGSLMYLKGKPHLGVWYPKDSPFNLAAYSNSDYAGASRDRKFTTGGCQFLGCRLISWQCKTQTVVATSSTEAEYVAAASCCAQVLWI